MMNLSQQLGIQYPIFLSPMAGVSTPQLAAEVSNVGGLGSLGLGASSVASCREQILATQALTTKPFQVNFFCHQTVAVNEQQHQTWIDYLRPTFARFGAEVPNELQCIYPSFSDNDDFLNLVIELKVPVVSFHFGIPRPEQLSALKNANIITMATATSFTEAKLIEQAGIDVIIAQGIEAGGHRGIFHPQRDAGLTTQELLRLLRQHLTLPIVATGGLMTGQDIRQCLDLGASACQLGTAFVQCASSNANTAYRQALFSQPITQITEIISGRPARGIVNQWHEMDTPQRPNVADYPYAYDIAKQLNTIAAKQGEVGYGAFWAGTGVNKIRDLDATRLMNVLIEEMSTL